MPSEQLIFIPGPYRKADPIWEEQFNKWIYKKDPNKSLFKIESITQRDDELGFRIDLTIDKTINAFITLHSQVPNPFGIGSAPFLILTSFPLPLREYFPIQFEHLEMLKKNMYRLYKNQSWSSDDNDPLINSLKDIEYDQKKYKRSVRDEYRLYYGSVVKTTSTNYRLFIVPSEETGSMVLQNMSFMELKMKKKKNRKLASLVYPSFLAIYEFLNPYYNKIISELDNIKNYYNKGIS